MPLRPRHALLGAPRRVGRRPRLLRSRRRAANALAADTGLDARFVTADVYDAADALEGERFDIVYTGLGALNWLPDLRRWASVVASLLVTGGFLYLAEFHPFTWVFADDDLSVVARLLSRPGGLALRRRPGTYADLDAETSHNVTLEWNHPISDVIGALLGAGLRLEIFNEHDYTHFPAGRSWRSIATPARWATSTVRRPAFPACP